eukprot:GHUV01021985.1.p1 GENE.GHUV01021985.1~~GHUV01021985.1.p1  ORF type:complete len:378 (+),score=52.14 GHUV01021985.1:404-1537(+)
MWSAPAGISHALTLQLSTFPQTLNTSQLWSDFNMQCLIDPCYSHPRLCYVLPGPLADYYGGRSLMLVSFTASAVCYIMTATATTMWMLFASRLATIMQHAVLAARTTATAGCTPSERATVLGYIGASYGIGFAMGPALGGWLSSISLTATAWAAAGGSVLALLVVLLGLPDDSPAIKSASHKQHHQDDSSKAATATGISLRSITSVCCTKGVPELLIIQAGAGLAQAIFQSTFSLVMQQQFGVDSKTNGLVLSYVGLCIVFAQSLLIKPLSSRLGEPKAVILCCGILATAFAIMSVSSQFWQVLGCLLPLACGAVTVSTLNTARLTKVCLPQACRVQSGGNTSQWKTLNFICLRLHMHTYLQLCFSGSARHGQARQH